MTRFARAKGSKSCNEKLPEEGTPWSEMKKGVLMNQQKGNQETALIFGNKSSTKEVKPLEWCSLDDEGEDCLNLLKSHLKKNVSGNKLEYSVDLEKKKRNEKCLEPEGDPLPKKKKEKVKNFINVTGGINSLKSKSKENERNNGRDEIKKESSTSGKSKKRKIEDSRSRDKSSAENNIRAKKKKVKISESQGKIRNEKSEEESVNEKSEMKDVKLLKKKKTIDNSRKNSKKLAHKITNHSCQIEKRKFKSDGNKFTTKINIGGEMVSLIKFQGFYVTKDDAKRLKEMKKKMHEEGIPESEIESVIKLERRKCEKSLARMKKNVCFQCRKPGHVLSQCPELQNKIETGTGICYKCGSTEHKAFMCKVMHKQKYPFAECFICKEKGHIARECPDNPRGLYPNGGCCKLCGDVTHLKKDCPTKILESEEKTLKVGVRDERNVEGLEEMVEKSETNNRKKQKKKLITY